MIGVDRERLVGADFLDSFTEPDRVRTGEGQVFSQGFVVNDYPLILRQTDGELIKVLYTAPVYQDAASEAPYSKWQLREFSETRAFLDNILQRSTKYSIIGM